MAFNTLTYRLSLTYGWTASNQQAGTLYQPTSNPTTGIPKTITLSSSIASTSSGGANELYSAMTNITASNSLSLDVTSVTDILGQTSINFVRVKSIVVQLLSTSDDSTFGTNASSLLIDGSVTNALLSTSNTGWLSTNTSKFVVGNGDFVAWGTTNATGLVVSNTNRVIKLTNQDAALTAAVMLTVVGSTS